MERYLISFDEGAMDHVRDEELVAAGVESRAVVEEAKREGVWIFGGGIARQRTSIVSVEGSVTDGPLPEKMAAIGGFCIVEVEGREDALAWAAKFAASCRCAQEVREIMFDPES